MTTDTKKKKRDSFWVQNDARLFRFSVKLIDGPMSETFMKANPKIIRVIEMRGDDTLGYLHEMIFKAFNRFDPHLYEFQFGGKKPMDRKFTHRYIMEEIFEEEKDDPLFGDMEPYANLQTGNAETTTVGSLNLEKKDKFFYWFDFGDDWWHEITVKAIEPEVDARKKYPRIAEKIGKSPKQYDESELGFGSQVYVALAESGAMPLMIPLGKTPRKKQSKAIKEKT